MHNCGNRVLLHEKQDNLNNNKFTQQLLYFDNFFKMHNCGNKVLPQEKQDKVL